MAIVSEALAANPEMLKEIFCAEKRTFELPFQTPLMAMVARCDSSLSGVEIHDWLLRLIDAHMNAARHNDNLSKGVFVAASKGNGSFVNSVIAALASIGHLHAPVWEARQVIFRGKKPGDRVPGFGNSFFKTEIDPAFRQIYTNLSVDYPDIYDQIVAAMPSIGRGRIPPQPNAAAITAAVCELIGYPDGLESEIFIHARLAVWADCWEQPPSLLA